MASAPPPGPAELDAHWALEDADEVFDNKKERRADLGQSYLRRNRVSRMSKRSPMGRTIHGAFLESNEESVEY